MSTTDQKSHDVSAAPTLPPLTMRDLATVLVKHYGLHDGHYDLLIEFQIGTGPVGPDKTSLIPGVMIGVSKMGLVPASSIGGTTTVNAADVNPASKVKKRRETGR